MRRDFQHKFILNAYEKSVKKLFLLLFLNYINAEDFNLVHYVHIYIHPNFTDLKVLEPFKML